MAAGRVFFTASTFMRGLLALLLGISLAVAENPYQFFTWKVTVGTISPTGTPQKAILINGEYPGPNINTTTNNNIVVNVFNNLEDPLLFSWHGFQQRKNSWQDGTTGTNCPIMPGTNFTYKFQAKDQIGSYYYYPSIGMQKASGGFGGIRINSRMYIPVPYDQPEDDYTVLIGDLYTQFYKALESRLDKGRGIGNPFGVHINGQTGKDSTQLFVMKPSKTYRYRICNIGIKVSLNFRIQGHNMLLVEMDGSHVVQNKYDSLDVHVGQCFSVLVTADKEPGAYQMVASTRFTKYHLSATGLIRYEGTKTPPSPDLPKAPEGWMWSLNQFESFEWNLTASAARPNPQGSYHYGSINITRTIILRNSVGKVDGKNRYSINGKSFKESAVPLKLAEYYGINDQYFKYDTIPDVPKADGEPIKIEPIVIKAVYRDFVEIIFENPEKSVQAYHLNGYSFFAVGMGFGRWSEASRKGYNLVDAVSRHTIQVYPNSWSAIMLTFDNAGMWNLRSEVWERSYLGQQIYVSVISPAKSLRDEYNMPESELLCGPFAKLPKPEPNT